MACDATSDEGQPRAEIQKGPGNNAAGEPNVATEIREQVNAGSQTRCRRGQVVG